MGLSELFSDFFSFSELHAEAPPDEQDEGEEGEEEKSEGSGDDSDEAKDKSAGDEEGDDDGGDEEEEEEEEEEEDDEPVDPKPKIEEGRSRKSFAQEIHSFALEDVDIYVGTLLTLHYLQNARDPPSGISWHLQYPRPMLTTLLNSAPLKHHFDECAERVHHQENNPNHKGPKEDCVEECKCAEGECIRKALKLTFYLPGTVFHLQHCAAACAAPKLFKVLK